MVLLLVCNVIPHRFNLRKANRKNPVAILPAKILKLSALGFDPERRTAFYLLDHFCGFASAGKSGEHMHVICGMEMRMSDVAI